MKHNLVILIAALAAAVHSDANTPKGADAQFATEELSLLAAPGVTVEDDGCCSVVITLAARPAETRGQLLARAWAAGRRWQRDNPGNRATFPVVTPPETLNGRTATWSSTYCRHTLDECP